MGSERMSDLSKVTQQSQVQGPIYELFTALVEATHFFPKRPNWASVPFCLGGLGQEMEQSLEIFVGGMNKRVAEVLPSPGSNLVTEPQAQ